MDAPGKRANMKGLEQAVRVSSRLFTLPKLGKHTTGKSCLYIKKLADVDPKVLETMAVRSVAAARARYSS